MNLNNSNKLKLWYDKPASEWVEALPLGNGSLGAMVYGDPFHENIQVNEETVWSAGENNNVNPRANELFKEVQRCILQGDLEQADILAKEAYAGNDQGSYQTLGDILMNFRYGEDKETVHSYRRELDIKTALSTVRYTIGGVNYRIESLISAVDNVFAMSMKASDGLTIHLEAALSRPENFNISEGKLPLSLVMKGHCADGSVQHCSMLKIIPGFQGWGKTGRSAYENGKLIIENGSNLFVIFAAATDFNNEDPEATCIERIEKAEKKGFDSIKNDHIADYEKLFNRVDLSLGEDKLYEFIPTNERLMRVADGNIDSSLVALYYQYGRYLLISSSRANSALPANLQGIWNNMTFAPWGSKFTININTEMNYWLAEQCNLSECHEPLFRLIDNLKKKGRIMAREMYGCKGFMAHHNTNIWGDASPQDNWPSATYWPMGAAWLCLDLWDRYEFTMDKDFLKEAYPTMKEACEFFVDFLVEDMEGRLVTCPSLSPENVYKTADGYATSICAGPTMDNTILRKLFSSTIESANILGLDKEFVTILSNIKSKLPELKIGRHGTIMEWPEDYEEVEIGHRHISQLFALHPAGEISSSDTPKLAVAARKTLERRLSHGGGHTGWSCAWIINMWARLWDAENAHKYVHSILAKSTYPNMFDAHPPFQIDGNFGTTAGITEMLLQSNGGMLNLLPALPKQWSEGYVRGLRGRGNYEIDLEWSNSELTKAVINTYTSTSLNTDCKTSIKIRYKNIGSYIVKCSKKIIPVTILSNDILTFEVNNGEAYTIEQI
jgi:alpha-L-fucosidase 2